VDLGGARRGDRYVLRLGPERFSQRNLSVNAQARAAEFDLQMSASFGPRCRRPHGDAAHTAAVNKQMENDPQNVVGKAEEVRVLRGELRGELATQIFRRISFFAASEEQMRVYPEKLAADLRQQLRPCTWSAATNPCWCRSARTRSAPRRAPAAAASARSWMPATAASTGRSWPRAPAACPCSPSSACWSCASPVANPAAKAARRCSPTSSIPRRRRAAHRRRQDRPRQHQQQVVQGDRQRRGHGAAVARERRRAAALAGPARGAASICAIERDALNLLAERVEGNLLAAVQELEKLRLLAATAHDRRGRRRGGGDSARFNLFA
jgi:hypothetical protein